MWRSILTHQEDSRLWRACSSKALPRTAGSHMFLHSYVTTHIDSPEYTHIHRGLPITPLLTLHYEHLQEVILVSSFYMVINSFSEMKPTSHCFTRVCLCHQCSCGLCHHLARFLLPVLGIQHCCRTSTFLAMPPSVLQSFGIPHCTCRRYCPSSLSDTSALRPFGSLLCSGSLLLCLFYELRTDF